MAGILPTVYNVWKCKWYDVVAAQLPVLFHRWCVLVEWRWWSGVFFPNSSFVTNNSFVTNTTHTHTNYPPSDGNDHIACYGGDPQGPQVTRHNRGGPLKGCGNVERKLLDIENGDVGVDPPLGDYMNQELICKIPGGHLALIGVFLKLINGGEFNIIMVCCE